MKCEMTNLFLTFVLGALLVFGVWFALQTIFHMHDFRSLQTQAIMDQGNMNRMNLLLNDAAEYSKTHPDIKPILQPFEKPVAH
jgi:hypothetical protein